MPCGVCSLNPVMCVPFLIASCQFVWQWLLVYMYNSISLNTLYCGCTNVWSPPTPLYSTTFCIFLPFPSYSLPSRIPPFPSLPSPIPTFPLPLPPPANPTTLSVIASVFLLTLYVHVCVHAHALCMCVQQVYTSLRYSVALIVLHCTYSTCNGTA